MIKLYTEEFLDTVPNYTPLKARMGNIEIEDPLFFKNTNGIYYIFSNSPELDGGRPNNKVDYKGRLYSWNMGDDFYTATLSSVEILIEDKANPQVEEVVEETVEIKTESIKKATLDSLIEKARAKGTTKLILKSPSGKTQEVVILKQDKYSDNEILSTFQKYDIEAIELAMEMNLPTLLIGHTGLGKTTLVKALGDAHGKVTKRFSVHSGITADEIIGKWLAKGGETVWQDGVLTEAMKKGEHFVMDEINACPADVLFQLHSLLDDDRHIIMSEKDGSILKPHDDFRFFGTMNPQDEYAGTKELNMAFLSRFTSVVTIDPFEKETEVKILQRKGISPANSNYLVDIANTLREMQTKQDIRFFCGIRDIINTGKLLEKGLPKQIALKVGILNKMDKDDAEEVLNKIGKSFTPIKSEKDKKIETLESNVQTKIKEVAQAVGTLDARNKEIITLKEEIEKLKTQTSSNTGGLTLDEKTIKALKILGQIK